MRRFLALLASTMITVGGIEGGLTTTDIRVSSILPQNCVMEEHSVPHLLTEAGLLLSVQSPQKKLKRVREGDIWGYWTDGSGHLMLNEEKNCVLCVNLEGETDRSIHLIKATGDVPFFDTMLVVDEFLYFALDQPYEDEEDQETHYAESSASGWYTGDRVMLTDSVDMMTRHLIHPKLKEVAEVQFYGYSVPTKVKAVDGDRIMLSDGSVWRSFPEMLERVDGWAKGENLETAAYPLSTWFGGEDQVEEYEQYIHIAYGNPGWDSPRNKEVLVALNREMEEAAVFWRDLR